MNSPNPQCFLCVLCGLDDSCLSEWNPIKHHILLGDGGWLYSNTDDFMVIADNGRVLGLGFIRAHLERRGKTVKWLWRAFIFSLQLRSSNLSGFSVETSNNYSPYTPKHTHMWVCFRSGWCHVSAVEWSSEGCMFPFLHFGCSIYRTSRKEAWSKFLNMRSFIRGVTSKAPKFNRTPTSY